MSVSPIPSGFVTVEALQTHLQTSVPREVFSKKSTITAVVVDILMARYSLREGSSNGLTLRNINCVTKTFPVTDKKPFTANHWSKSCEEIASTVTRFLRENGLIESGVILTLQIETLDPNPPVGEGEMNLPVTEATHEGKRDRIIKATIGPSAIVSKMEADTHAKSPNTPHNQRRSIR